MNTQARILKYVKSILLLFFFVSSVLLFALSFFINLKILGKIVAQDQTIDNIFIIHNFWIFKIILFLSGCTLFACIICKEKIQRTMIQYKKELILFFIICLLCSFFLEISSYYVLKYHFSHYAFQNQKINYNNIEFNNTVAFNNYGFRDDNFTSDDKSFGEYKIAMVGDSFVFGVGVQENETFEKKIEEELNKKSKVKVYNLGVSNSYPSDYLSVIEEIYPIIQPNLTIVVFYLGNDLVCTKETKISAISSYFFPNIRKLFKIMFQIYSEQEENKIILANSDLKEEYKTEIKDQTINPYLFMGGLYNPNLTSQYSNFIDWFDACTVNKNILKEIKKTTEQFGSQMLLVILPVNYQVTDDNWNIMIKLGYKVPDKKMLEERKLQDDFLKFCREENITCLDVLWDLRVSKEHVYYMYDEHFTSIGYNITATAILELITKREQIPDDNH